MTPSDIRAELADCQMLRQKDIDWLIERNVPPLALARSWDGLAAPLYRDSIVAVGSNRFEFRRYMSDEPEAQAFIIPALDAFGEMHDIVAWNRNFTGNWLGRAHILGEEHLAAFRLANDIVVHPAMLPWLQADRRGVVVVDEERAGELLRPYPLRAADKLHGQFLRRICTAPQPRISVPAALKEAA